MQHSGAEASGRKALPTGLVQGLGFWSAGFRVLECRVLGFGFWVGFRFQGSAGLWDAFCLGITVFGVGFNGILIQVQICSASRA